MKILIVAMREYFVCSLIDEAISLSEAGHDIYFVYNNCSMGICSYNMSQNTYTCELCRRKMRKAIKLLPKAVKKINIEDFWDKNKEYHYEYNSAQDIKKIEYKNVKVGYAVMSTYISRTRNLQPLINEVSKRYFDLLISAVCGLSDAIERTIDTLQPDKVYLWNGRLIESRPVFDIACAKRLEIVCLDKAVDQNGNNRKGIFINHTPHDINGLQHNCDVLWQDTSLPLEEKISIGKSFYERRRFGLRTNDKVYISGQQKGRMPQNWDNSRRNIVIFNSSEDELAAIGEDFDRLALFDSQYQGIIYILETLKNIPDIRVYLRIHPNLASIPYRYHTELLKLSSKYENLTVIPAADPVSTYDLMESAEKIVVFGSTMGLESAYWGKAVILLAGTYYYQAKLCYVPETKQELKTLLLQTLKPKENIEAIKWGFYLMYMNPTSYTKYVDIDMRWFNVWKYRLREDNYLKLFGSSKLYAIYLYLITRKARKRMTSLVIPIEEDRNVKL